MAAPKSKSPVVAAARDIAAGTCGGIVVTLVGHPFDTLKVLLQTQPTKNPIYSGLVDCFQKTVKAEGLQGLYRGMSSPLMGQMFFRAALFLSYGQSKTLVGASPDRPLSYCAAGGLAWGFASLAEGPIDFYKSQMQKQIIQAKQDPNFVSKYPSIFSCIRASFAANGVTAPFQGLGATLMRNVPAAAFYFGANENIKNHFLKASGAATNSVPELMVAGGTAGILFWITMYPIDVIKSAIMTDEIPRSERRFSGILDVVRKLLNEGGIARFYKGIEPCLLRAVPANALMLLTVDLVKPRLPF